MRTEHSLDKSTPLVRARGLTKLFGQHKAVDNIDFDIYPGEIVGFLGPNGAGKTTTIRMLLNLLSPSMGELTLFGLNYQQNRPAILRQMNSSSGSISLPGKLSIRETLAVFADMYGIAHAKDRIKDVIKKFDLESLKHKSLYSLSTGQQVRVSLAKSFLNQPKLLLLDEPTASLDPDVAQTVRTYLLDVMKTENTTVFLTSHNMREVETVCSRVLFLNKGKIEAEGSPEELAKRVKRWKIRLRTKPKLLEIPSMSIPAECDLHLERGELQAEMDKNQIGPFLTHLIKKGFDMESLSITEPTLEDFFVHQTNRTK